MFAILAPLCTVLRPVGLDTLLTRVDSEVDAFALIAERSGDPKTEPPEKVSVEYIEGGKCNAGGGIRLRSTI